ncbi:MAG: zinc-binding alcohol dehydrogenase family protein [Gammaproteobacteria bacterium]|nr:zinc-binding alcohol dehydrogenase family protein [Gammaproteobacteria bacterium]MBU1833770.1 zinc-binding alcohol dehydrogenase family protein [Gammaproteobacteria bacterium]
MKAAVVHAYDSPPQFLQFDQPQPATDEVLVTVKAAALSQLVRAQASGKHYSSPALSFVPGVDGVGYLENGERVYFAFPPAPVGAMAEKVAVKAAYTVALPSDVDDITAAAIANPGMSSWASLTDRAKMRAGESVLINGATGASGRLAIQIAKHLGAGRVIATGRNPATEADLRALGADEFIPLNQGTDALAQRFRDEIANGVDIVLDYLWGPSAGAFITAATSHGAGDAAPRIRFVNIGGLGGPELAVPAGALRSSGLELMGSGLGSVSNVALVNAIGAMMKVVTSVGLRIETRSAPLAEIESAWLEPGAARLVFTL